MNRWVVAILVLLALVLLVSPGIIGRMAGDNVEAVIEKTEAENPGLEISLESLDEGWFITEGRHRLVFSGGRFGELRDEYRETTGYPELFSLLIDTRLDHGLIPVTSLNRDGGSLAPGLASAVSTFHVDPGNGELIDVPGALYSQVALGGGSKSRLLLEEASYDIDVASIDFGGTDLDLSADARGGDIAVSGRILPWSLTAPDGSVQVGEITIEADQRATGYGYRVGPVDVAVGRIEATSPDAAFAVGGMRMVSDSGIREGRLDTNGRFELDGVEVPGFGSVHVALGVTMNGLEPAAFGSIAEAFREAQADGDPAQAFEAIWPRIEADFETLAASGGQFRIDELNVTLPQGVIATDLSIDLPVQDADAAFSWGSVLLNMTASMNVSVPGPIFEMAAMMNPQANQLLAMGIIIKDEDDYVMAAEYAQGLVNVNGAPLPIPIPGLQ